jgi:hypothetical protein
MSFQCHYCPGVAAHLNEKTAVLYCNECYALESKRAAQTPLEKTENTKKQRVDSADLKSALVEFHRAEDLYNATCEKLLNEKREYSVSVEALEGKNRLYDECILLLHGARKLQQRVVEEMRRIQWTDLPLATEKDRIKRRRLHVEYLKKEITRLETEQSEFKEVILPDETEFFSSLMIIVNSNVPIEYKLEAITDLAPIFHNNALFFGQKREANYRLREESNTHLEQVKLEYQALTMLSSETQSPVVVAPDDSVREAVEVEEDKITRFLHETHYLTDSVFVHLETLLKRKEVLDELQSEKKKKKDELFYESEKDGLEEASEEEDFEKERAESELVEDETIKKEKEDTEALKKVILKAVKTNNLQDVNKFFLDRHYRGFVRLFDIAIELARDIETENLFNNETVYERALLTDTTSLIIYFAETSPGGWHSYESIELFENIIKRLNESLANKSTDPEEALNDLYLPKNDKGDAYFYNRFTDETLDLKLNQEEEEQVEQEVENFWDLAMPEIMALLIEDLTSKFRRKMKSFDQMERFREQWMKDIRPKKAYVEAMMLIRETITFIGALSLEIVTSAIENLGQPGVDMTRPILFLLSCQTTVGHPAYPLENGKSSVKRLRLMIIHIFGYWLNIGRDEDNKREIKKKKITEIFEEIEKEIETSMTNWVEMIEDRGVAGDALVKYLDITVGPQVKAQFKKWDKSATAKVKEIKKKEKKKNKKKRS